MVELNPLFQNDRGKTASAARGTVELNCLFKKDRGKTAARILSPNPTQRPLPCLIIQSFFYGTKSRDFRPLICFRQSISFCLRSHKRLLGKFENLGSLMDSTASWVNKPLTIIFTVHEDSALSGTAPSHYRMGPLNPV